MVRPCVARGLGRAGGERSCINVSGLWLELIALRAIMEISAPAVSLADRPQRAKRVTSARMRREVRSSISSYPLADLGGLKVWGYVVLLMQRSAIKQSARLPRRSSSPRRSDNEQERSRRCEPACWRAQLPTRWGAAAFWPPRATA